MPSKHMYPRVLVEYPVSLTLNSLSKHGYVMKSRDCNSEYNVHHHDSNHHRGGIVMYTSLGENLVANVHVVADLSPDPVSKGCPNVLLPAHISTSNVSQFWVHWRFFL